MDPILQTDQPNYFVNLLFRDIFLHPCILHKVLVPGQKLVHFRVLHNCTNVANGTGKVLADAFPADNHVTLCNPDQADNHPDRRRFTGAIGAEKAEYLSFVYRKTESFDDFFSFDHFFYIVQLQNGIQNCASYHSRSNHNTEEAGKRFIFLAVFNISSLFHHLDCLID
ncbi:Uncharacterised protein [Mycobacteroides abscessus subsp. abscessus]|nr:Uncharacterised protein [Mycobacteroides abscessus subsp. abscessus]